MAHWREHLYQSPRKVADTIWEAVHGWRKINIHTESHWFICITWFSTGICTRSTDKDLFTAGRKHHYSWYGFTYWRFQVGTIHMIQQETMKSTLCLSSDSYKVVQIWLGLIFFFKTIIAKHLLAHVSLQRTPLRSQHIFSNVLEASWYPFQKKACGWRRVHSRTVWMTASRPLKFTTDSNNSMGKGVSHRPMCLSGVSASERAESACRMNRMIVGHHRCHPDCSGVDTPPTTSLFWKGYQDASRTLEKMCWLRRGVRWRLTCASECLAIMV